VRRDLSPCAGGRSRCYEQTAALKDVTAEHLFEAVRVVAAGEALLAPPATRKLIAEFAQLRSHSSPVLGPLSRSWPASSR
jgi:hypothetical protein